MSYGVNIKNFRNERGLTQGKFGALIGKTAPTVHRYETGEIVPPVEIANLIETVTGGQVNAIKLVFGEEAPHDDNGKNRRNADDVA